MTAYQQVVAAWNAQADETNQWDSLGEDEKIEWALKCCDQFRGATKMMQAARQEPTRKYLTVVFRDLTKDEAKALIYHEKMSAASWSHALHERDMAKAALLPDAD